MRVGDVMQKPARLKRGDQVAIVSLSSGILGEPSSQHQLVRGVHRLMALGLQPVIMPYTLRGLTYLKQHPEARAADLKAAFLDPQIKGIVAAIGGDDTYRLAPYLLDDPEFVQAVQQHPKLVTGFSDTTINHLMFYRLGLQTFYGPNFLNDLAELEGNMLPYTAQTWAHYFQNPATTAIVSSEAWYEERTEFSVAALNQPRVCHAEQYHYEVLRGQGQVTGRLLGGCIDSFDDLLTTNRYPDEATIAKKYQLVPPASDWQDKILFIETSNECPTPEKFAGMLAQLKRVGILGAVVAIVMGKPQDEQYYDAYKPLLLAATKPFQTAILYNANFGHAYPRTALPYGAIATIDFDAASFSIQESFFKGTVTVDD